jgi:hypothetical protein
VVRLVNERELQLVHTVSTIIESDGSTSTYLLHAKYTNLVRVNLVLLKALLEEKRRKGLMVTIDSPHQYISHLMQLHGVDQTNLVFLDTISNHASDTKAGTASPEFQRGPFQIETLPDFLYGRGNGGPKSIVDMDNVEFVVIDNVSTLLTYNTMESIKRFFQNYLGVVGKTRPNGVQTLLAMDRDQHPDLFKFIAAFSKKAIDLNPDMSLKSVSISGMALPESQQSSPQTSVGTRSADQGIPRNKEVM